MEPTRKKSLKLNPKFLKGINKNSVVLLDNYGNNSTKLLKSKWNNTQIGTTSLAQQFFFSSFHSEYIFYIGKQNISKYIYSMYTQLQYCRGGYASKVSSCKNIYISLLLLEMEINSECDLF